MANYNLSTQQIKDSFEQLAQVSGSIEGGVSGYAVVDGTGSRVNTLHVTASQATSASYAPNTGVTSIIAGTNVTIDQATGDVTINSSGGGGGSTDTGSLLVTASNVDDTITYTKGDGSTFQNIINNVAFATEAEDLVITVKNTSGGTLAKGTAVHAVSVTGENVNVIAASNDSAAAMPAIGLLSAELTNNSAGTCIIAGRDTGLNTSGLVAGASVYVSTGGALTSTKPIGSALIQNIGTAAKIDASDGEIIIQGAGRTNDLPNLTNNYVWVGDSDGVPQPTAVAVLDVLSAFSATSASYARTASIVTDPNIAYINKNNTFTGTQSFDNISVSGTGSFAYIQSVTGSAKTIGDAFIILNNNTPTQVYAGVKVQDSGSTATTASIQWDGINDQWFFEKEVSAAGEFGVVMSGPEYSDIATPAYLTNNRIAKGNGSHHLNDSNISDNGSIVDINSNTKITGSLTQSGSGLSFFTNGAAGGETKTIAYSDMTNAGGTTYTENYFGIIDYPPGIYDNALTMFKGTAAFGQYSHNFSNGDSAGVQLKTVSGSFGTIDVFTGTTGDAVAAVSGDNIFITATGRLKLRFDGGTTEISSSVDITGSLKVDQGVQMKAGAIVTGSAGISGSLDVVGTATVSKLATVKALTTTEGNVKIGQGVNPYFALNIGSAAEPTRLPGIQIFTSASQFAGTTNYAGLNVYDGDYGGTFVGNVQNHAGSGTVAPANEAVFAVMGGAVGDSILSDNTIFYADNIDGSPKFTKTTIFQRDVQVSGSLQVTGSLRTTGSIESEVVALAIASNSSSLDATNGSFFTLDLVDGADTHINQSNTTPGQTYTLKTTNGGAGTGTISFNSGFKFSDGTAPTATATAAAVDIYTFVTYTTNEVYATAVTNLS